MTLVSDSAAEHDVVIVGGGVIGLAVGWRLANADIDVCIVDPAPGRGASWAAAGMLAPVTEAHYGEDLLLALNVASSELWPEFAEDLAGASGVDVAFRKCGTILVARDGDENAALEHVYEFQLSHGLPVTRVAAKEARSLEPALSPRVRGAVIAEGDHQVDNRALVEALKNACDGAGVRWVKERATRVTTADGRVDGVATESGRRLRCSTAIVAAGCWSTQVEVPDVDRISVRPVKGQLLHLRGADPAPLTHRNVRGADVYIVARDDGRVVVGATVEERGFDTSVTAGAVYELLRDAYELVPAITELQLVETSTGLRPGTPDNAPLLGPAHTPGLVFATGHFRNGVLLTPITADIVASAVTSGTWPTRWSPLWPRRFSEEPV